MEYPGASLRGDASAAEKSWRLADWAAAYRNERAINTEVYKRFDGLARSPEWLSRHRDWVEANHWGFGDRALHHMWRLLLEHLASQRSVVRCIEIGVFKGQVISLWGLIAARQHLRITIAAVSPFSGSSVRLIRDRAINKLLKIVHPGYREAVLAGNIYPNGDYLEDCRRIFSEFDLNFDMVEAIQGFSTDTTILSSLAERSFDLIYIDGDHSKEGAMHDVRSFAPKVSLGGMLVMDDASLSLEMDLPYRGRPGPSKAAELLPSLGFRNILNVGHNRIFQKV